MKRWGLFSKNLIKSNNMNNLQNNQKSDTPPMGYDTLLPDVLVNVHLTLTKDNILIMDGFSKVGDKVIRYEWFCADERNARILHQKLINLCKNNGISGVEYLSKTGNGIWHAGNSR